MFCKRCGESLPDGLQFCTKCGAPTSDNNQAQPTPKHDVTHEPPSYPSVEPTPSAPPKPTPPRRFLAPLLICLASLAVIVCVGLIGYLNNWFGLFPSSSAGSSQPGISDTTGGGASSGSVDGVAPKSSLNDYTWDELSLISQRLASSYGQVEAIQIAYEYGLCGPNGELSGMTSKEIVLSNGTVCHARIIGFNHDRKSDGGLAGMTFLFDEVVATAPWNQSGFNDGGWQSSSARSWLSLTFFDTLPDDLKSTICSVEKLSNNSGGVDTGELTPSIVTTTSDKIWLLSHVELAGDDPEDVHWAVSHYHGQYTWCNDITSQEGTQYALFQEVDTQGFSPNGILVREYEGTPWKWWMRSANPHISFDTLAVAENGALNDDVGSIEAQGMVPAFCI